jgi:hypothetical protein
VARDDRPQREGRLVRVNGEADLDRQERRGARQDLDVERWDLAGRLFRNRDTGLRAEAGQLQDERPHPVRGDDDRRSVAAATLAVLDALELDDGGRVGERREESCGDVWRIARRGTEEHHPADAAGEGIDREHVPPGTGTALHEGVAAGDDHRAGATAVRAATREARLTRSEIDEALRAERLLGHPGIP